MRTTRARRREADGSGRRCASACAAHLRLPAAFRRSTAWPGPGPWPSAPASSSAAEPQTAKLVSRSGGGPRTSPPEPAATGQDQDACPSGSQQTTPPATNPSRLPDTTVSKRHGLRHDRDRRTNAAVAGRTDQCIHSKEGTSRTCRPIHWRTAPPAEQPVRMLIAPQCWIRPPTGTAATWPVAGSVPPDPVPPFKIHAAP